MSRSKIAFLHDPNSAELRSLSFSGLTPPFHDELFSPLNHLWKHALQRFVSGRLYVGTYNDLELTTYLIRTDDGDLLEREYAFVSTVVVGYDFKPWFSAFVGPGYEFEANKNFFVFRAGVEFMKELTERYTVSIPLYYDHKDEYSAIGIGLAVAWKF